MNELSLQRRIQRVGIRLQARLEAGIGDRWIPMVLSAALASVVGSLAVAQFESLASGRELAHLKQSIWLIQQGMYQDATVVEGNIVETSGSLLVYPLALLASVFEVEQMLLTMQAVAIGVTVLPLWGVARQVVDLRIGASTALLLAYVLNPITHQLAIEDFHLEVLAIPAFVAMVYFGARKKWLFYWICIAWILLCRADLGLAVALWGFLLLGDGVRKRGFWTMSIGFGWSLGFLLILKPLLGQELVLTWGNLFAEENFALAVALLAPLLFLSLISFRHLLPALPLAILYVVASDDSAYYDPTVLLLPFVFIAAAYAMNRLGYIGVDSVFLDARLLLALVTAALFFYIDSSIASPYARPWEWRTLDETDKSVLQAIDSLEDDTNIWATTSALVPLADRENLAILDEPILFYPESAQAIIIVERDIAPRTEEEKQIYDQRLDPLGFRIAYAAEDVKLYRRD